MHPLCHPLEHDFWLAHPHFPWTWTLPSLGSTDHNWPRPKSRPGAADSSKMKLGCKPWPIVTGYISYIVISILLMVIFPLINHGYITIFMVISPLLMAQFYSGTMWLSQMKIVLIWPYPLVNEQLDPENSFFSWNKSSNPSLSGSMLTNCRVHRWWTTYKVGRISNRHGQS